MILTGNTLADARHLGFSLHLANVPGITAEKGRELGVKYAAQNSVREKKFEKIQKALLGTK
jgi:hypothetical protein